MRLADAAIVVGTLATGIVGWFLIVIWAAWQRTWWIGGLAGTAFVVVVVLLSQNLGGPHPLPYGLLLALSLFVGAIVVTVGIIEAATKMVARRRDG